MNLSRTLLIILVLNLAVAVGSVYINYQFFVSISEQTKKNPSNINNDGNSMSSVSSHSGKPKEFIFHTIEKLIISIPNEDREYYFIFDLVLQAETKIDPKKLEKIDPAVRSAVVSFLSTETYTDIRSIPLSELQANLENAIFEDFANKNIQIPFQHVLVSKLLVQ